MTCKEYLIITACVLMGISYCFSGIISYFIFKNCGVYIIKNNTIYNQYTI